MHYTVKHEVPGRIRLGLGGKIPDEHAIALENMLEALPCVDHATAYPKAGSISVTYAAGSAAYAVESRKSILSFLEHLDVSQVREWKPEDSTMLAPRPRQLYADLARLTVFRLVKRCLMPMPIRRVISFFGAIPYWRAAGSSLRKGRLDVPVLDAAAISMGFLGSNASSGSTMYMLHIGETLEDYTQRRSECSLAQSLLDIPTSARLLDGETEVEVPLDQLSEGMLVVARLGDAVPVDGTVVRGEACINQSSLTGESAAVVRQEGDTVYAGTAIESGEVVIRVEDDPRASKIRSITSMMDQAEAFKSEGQRRVEMMADKLVPWNFLLAAVVAATTRSLTKTSAALMVDYSCALRLSGSIAVMAAQKESAAKGFVVKGSKYFESMAEADAIIFDKTGTLTTGHPAVRDILTCGTYSRKEALRLAACLEEHFPHPVARAVVKKANEENLQHRERHAEVEYIVAHGIASSLDGKRVVIGSKHFVLEDEEAVIDPGCLELIDKANTGGYSPLYLAVDGKLEAVLFIEDPLKKGIRETVAQLKAEGFKRVIMLTGDNSQTASQIALEAGIDEYEADLLPEDKYRIVNDLQAQGYKVAMVGDGVNDSPALAAASVSIAMGGGSAIARETADISLVSNDLAAIVSLRRMSRELDKRMRFGYKFAVGFNSLLMALGISSVLTPQVSSLLHNASTIGLSVANSRKFLPEAGESKG